MTALKALKIARAAKLDLTLSIYGKGDSSYMADLRSFVVSNQLPVEFLNVSNQNTDRSPPFTSGTTPCCTRRNGPSRFRLPRWRRWAAGSR